MSFEVRFSRRAIETFDAVVIQLNQRWGNKFVSKFKAKVSNSLDIIAESPFIYPIAQKNTN
jgi:hypothetical protein